MKFITPPEWKTIHITETNAGLLVRVELLTRPLACPHCDASPEALRDHGVTALSARDIPLNVRPVEISLTRRRYLCSVCNSMSLQPISGVAEGHRMTDRLIQLVAQRAFRTPLEVVAAEFGLSEKLVGAIVSEEIERMERMTSFDAPRVLEVRSVRLGDRERLLLADAESRRVISIATGANQETAARALLTLRNREAVGIVTLPMSRSLWSAVRRILPQAKASVDRFRVMDLGSEAFDAVRERVCSCSPRPKNGKELLATAWLLRARFIDVFRTDTSLEARRRFLEWAASLPAELDFAFRPLVQTVEAWSVEIFCYFDHHFATARPGERCRPSRPARRSGRPVKPQKNRVDGTHDTTAG